MRIVYYTRPAFLFHSLGLARAMSQFASVHMLLELSPEERAAGTFGEAGITAAPGVRPAADALREGYLAGAQAFVANLASFDLVVHPGHRAFGPSTLRVALSAAARIRALAPDVVHFEDIAPRTAPLLYLTPGRAKLVSIHDARTHRGDPVTRAEAIRRIAMRQATRALFYSRFTHDLFFRTAPHLPASVLPLPLFDVYRDWSGQADVPEREHSLLFFGRLSTYKGLDVLYAALPLIAERVRGLRVVIAGEVGQNYRLPPPPVLPSDAVLETHLERIDVPLLRNLFQSTSLVVLPYLEASQSGVVPLAYAFGKPVVASAVGGLPEFVRDGVTGRLVPPGDPEALARAVSEVLLSPESLAKFKAGIQQIERDELGWPTVAPQLAAIYQRTAQASTARQRRRSFGGV